jgi:hypothetical protein
MTGAVTTTNSNNSYRLQYGQYGMFMRLDEHNAYLLSTLEGFPAGTWSGFRPLAWSLSTGEISLGSEGTDNNSGNYQPPQKVSVWGGLHVYGLISPYGNTSGYEHASLVIDNEIGNGFGGQFMMRNSSANAPSPKKWLRINNTGALEIVNSEYNLATFSFTNSGTFTATGNVAAYSDRKIKDNIEVIGDALDKVLAIRGVTFTRTDVEDKVRRHTGVIAQEVELVLPEVVTEDDYGIKTVAYGNMVGLLIEAIKELTAKVNDLENQIRDLKK